MEHIIGLDIETTSTNIEGRLIQIGIATESDNVFVSDVVYQLAEAGSFEIQPEALEVNRFSLDRIFGATGKFPFVQRTAPLVDSQAVDWLKEEFPLPAEHRKQINFEREREEAEEKRARAVPTLDWYITQAYKKSFICVGWNVGSFDLPFVRRELPILGSLMHYRTIDLNAVCFTAERVLATDYRELKDEAKEYAEDKIVGAADWHDAGYDALASLKAWEYLIEKMSQLPDA